MDSILCMEFAVFEENGCYMKDFLILFDLFSVLILMISVKDPCVDF